MERTGFQVEKPTHYRTFLGQEDGAAFVEVALVLPMLILLLVSAVQGAFILQALMRIADSASMGARFGTVAGNAANLTGMQNAATAAANGLPGFSVTASMFCSCLPNGTPVTCPTNGTPTKPLTCSVNTPYQYVKVSTSASIPLLFNIYGSSGVYPISSVMLMRVAPQ